MSYRTTAYFFVGGLKRGGRLKVGAMKDFRRVKGFLVGA